jgi:hypothetical protein
VLRIDLLLKALEASKDVIDGHDETFCMKWKAPFQLKCGEYAPSIYGKVSRSWRRHGNSLKIGRNWLLEYS